MLYAKRLFLLLLLLVASHYGSAQNLVPNPSFENYTQCPTGTNGVIYATPWDQPTNGSSDYFHACANGANSLGVPQNFTGDQQARTGQAYMGMLCYFVPTPTAIYYYEYLQVQLTQPLVANELYWVDFYVSPADNYKLGVTELGLAFSDDDIWLTIPHLGDTLTADIQGTAPLLDLNGWTQVGGYYQANGGEEYIVIGMFTPDTLITVTPTQVSGNFASYYYIDDVSVSSAGLTILGDTIACQGDSISLTAYNGSSYTWENTDAPGISIGTGANLTVTPNGSSTYMVYSGSDTTYHYIFVGNAQSSAIDLGPDTSLCANSTHLLDFNLPGAAATWQDGSTTQTYLVDQPGTYWVNVFNGCDMLSDSITITYQSQITLNLGADTLMPCHDDALVLQSNVNGSGYLWSDGSALDTLTVTQAGSYTLQVNHNCGPFTDDITVSYPDSIALSTTSTDEMQGSDGTINLLVFGGTPGYTFDWDNDGLGDNDDPQNLSNLDAGTYIVIVTDANGCQQTITVTVGTQVGMTETAASLPEVQIYPNPNQGQFRVTFSRQPEQGTQLEIYNATGQLVAQQQITAVETQINLETSPGLYLMRVLAPGQAVQYLRFVKVGE